MLSCVSHRACVQVAATKKRRARGSTRLLAINRDGVARHELNCSWWNIVDAPDIDMLDDRISDSQPVRCDVRQMVFCSHRSRRRILSASGLQMFQVEIFRVFSISALLGFPRNDNCVHLARWYLARAAVSSPTSRVRPCC